MKKQYDTLIKTVSAFAVIIALILFIIKIIAWWFTHSVSILASLVDSCMDIAASTINFFAIRYALRPADKGHTFGHGKAESLSALAQSMFICGSALFLLLSAIQRIMEPQPLSYATLGIIVMIVSTFLSLSLVFTQRWVVKQTGSQAIKADKLHYETDSYINITILIALFLSTYGFIWVDGVFALVISGYIFYSAMKIGYEAIHALLDHALSQQDIAQIEMIARSFPEVLGVHDLRTRQAGKIKFIQLHLELDDNLPLIRAHAIADNVEQSLYAHFPYADIIIHQDPSSVVSKELSSQQRINHD